jgi:transcriptional regulator with XRE-family HTH domain
MSLPERLASLRKRAELSAAALSDLAGLSPAHVAMIETGARPNLAASTALALARTLGTTFEHLVSGEGVEPTDAEVKAAVERARGRVASEPRAAAPASATVAPARRHAKRTSTATDHGNADRLRIDRDPSFDQTAPVARAR